MDEIDDIYETLYSLDEVSTNGPASVQRKKLRKYIGKSEYMVWTAAAYR